MAPLSLILQNMKKTLLFHEFVHKVLPNFGCSELKLFTLSYHNVSEVLRLSWALF